MKKFLAVFAVVALMAFAAPAFAANPFMDVPAGHWAYDAVDQLAARGIVSGYPDGAFKGAQPATRYEVASVVARALAVVDVEKASKQDLAMLKKLVMEFKDELDALGVKVGSLDKRVAVLEDRLGGWKLTGEFRFDAKFAGGNRNPMSSVIEPPISGDTGNTGGMVNGPEIMMKVPSMMDYSPSYNYYGLKDNMGTTSKDKGQYDRQFGLNRARLHFTKFIDENTTFYGRLDGMDAEWSRFQITTMLPYDVQFRVGRFNFDWEGDANLYNPMDVNNDATFGDYDVDGFQFQKNFGMFTATAVVARNLGFRGYGTWDTDTSAKLDNGNYMTYALRLHADFSERFRAGAMAYWMNEDQGEKLDGDYFGDFSTYAVYAGFDFTPNITLQGIYYWQKLDNLKNYYDWDEVNDTPTSWKAQLIVKQEALKFTSLWIEYAEEDNTFFGNNRYGYTYNWVGANPTWAIWNDDVDMTSSTKIFFVRADQQWNDKFSTFLRYAKFDFGTEDMDDVTNWSAGMSYQYTPAVNFQFIYDNIDYGNNPPVRGGAADDHLFRFRTTVNF